MKKYVLAVLLLASPALAEPTKTVYNVFSGKLDFITKVDSSTLPSGSTQYVQIGETLQSGATFYVSSGTVANLTVSTITGISPTYQVVIGTCGVDTTSTSATFADMALQATITTKSSHRVRVRAALQFASNAGGAAGQVDGGIRLLRDGGTLATWNNMVGFGFVGAPSSNYGYRCNADFDYVDTGVSSPGTYVYKLQMNNTVPVGTILTYCGTVTAGCRLYLEEIP
jgi:hypothetical protein